MKNILLPLLFLSCFLVTSCGKIKLSSEWCRRNITIDGNDIDWKGMSTLEKENISILLANDSEHMFVCLSSSDPEIQRQVLLHGFTVWFNPKGKGKFGIRFPMGKRKTEHKHDKKRDTFMELGLLMKRFNRSDKTIEILGPGKDQSRFLALEDIEKYGIYGIKADIGTSDGKMIYELKVPLRKNTQHRYAIGTASGDLIDMAFEAGEPDDNMGGMQSP